MGKLLRLNGVTLSGNNPRIITRDPIESAGSLMLLDGGNMDYSFAGLPVVGEQLPNVLSHSTRSIVGVSPLESELHFTVASRSDDSATFKAERTNKGGIHGISSLSGNQAVQEVYRIAGPRAVSDWIYNNPNHSYYISYWETVTRAGNDNAAPQSPFHFASQTGSTANYHFYFEGGQAESKVSPTLFTTFPFDDHSTDLIEPANRLEALQCNQFIGNGPDQTSDITLLVGIGGAWGGFNQNNGASRIIYRAYIEDLTLSERTFNEVRTIDSQLFTEAFASGGKFNADTYTAPSTIA